MSQPHTSHNHSHNHSCFNCKTPAALCNGKCAYLSLFSRATPAANADTTKRPTPRKPVQPLTYFAHVIRSAHNSRRSWSLGQLLPPGYPPLRYGKNVLVSSERTIACNFADKLVEQLCSDKTLAAYYLTLVYSSTHFVTTPRDTAAATLPTAILLNRKVHLLPKLLTSPPTGSISNAYALTPGPLTPTRPTPPATTPYACIWFNTIDVTRPTLFTRDPCAVYNYLSWLVSSAGRAHDLSLIAYCETFAKEFFKIVDICY